LKPETKKLAFKLGFVLILWFVAWTLSQILIGVAVAVLGIAFHFSAATIVFWVSLLKKVAFVALVILAAIFWSSSK
jgi:hypothetical protein